MYDYYCKNCNNIIGKWYNRCKFHDISAYCYRIESKNINSLYFLNCYKCNKFVGINCKNVCKNCFGEDEIFGDKKIFKWFKKYKKIINFDYYCKKCGMDDFRRQCWFFGELTFYKK